MSCLYPQNAPRTAYTKGCRCDRCVTTYRQRNRTRTPFGERSPTMKARYPVPIGPVLRLVERWLAAYARETHVTPEALKRGARLRNEVSPLTGEQVLKTRAGYNGEFDRLLWSWRRGQRLFTSWETADRVLTACYGPHVWQNEPELREVYERQPKGDELLTPEQIAQWAIETWDTYTEDDKRAWRACEPSDFLPPARELAA